MITFIAILPPSNFVVVRSRGRVFNGLWRAQMRIALFVGDATKLRTMDITNSDGLLMLNGLRIRQPDMALRIGA